ncbi:hypothetical protein MMC31_000566, partial [Peltigera leucophlebia]|nr:hypothetical protein [Peltigera leucophlebia]
QIDLTDVKSTPDVTSHGTFKWIPHPGYCIITEDDIEKHMVDDEQYDVLIRDEQRQLDAETRLRKELDVDEVDMTGTIASSGLTNLAPDETASE